MQQSGFHTHAGETLDLVRYVRTFEMFSFLQPYGYQSIRLPEDPPPEE